MKRDVSRKGLQLLDWQLKGMLAMTFLAACQAP